MRLYILPIRTRELIEMSVADRSYHELATILARLPLFSVPIGTKL